MSDLQLSKELGFLRICGAVPVLRVADIDFNVENIIEAMKKARNEGVQVLIFPEMAITGYTIGDLVQHQALLSKATKGLRRILEASTGNPMLVIMGIPLDIEQKIFNCAVALNSGHLLGVIPKTLLPSYKEFYEDRWFTSSMDARSDLIELLGERVQFGTDILFGLHGHPSALIGGGEFVRTCGCRFRLTSTRRWQERRCLLTCRRVTKSWERLTGAG